MFNAAIFHGEYTQLYNINFAFTLHYCTMHLSKKKRQIILQSLNLSSWAVETYMVNEFTSSLDPK